MYSVYINQCNAIIQWNAFRLHWPTSLFIVAVDLFLIRPHQLGVTRRVPIKPIDSPEPIEEFTISHAFLRDCTGHAHMQNFLGVTHNANNRMTSWRNHVTHWQTSDWGLNCSLEEMHGFIVKGSIEKKCTRFNWAFLFNRQWPLVVYHCATEIKFECGSRSGLAEVKVKGLTGYTTHQWPTLQSMRYLVLFCNYCGQW